MEKPDMNENERSQRKIPEQNQNSLPERHRLLGGVEITERDKGARLSWSEDKTELRVNTSLYSDEDTARFAALRQVATHIGLTQAVRTDANVLIDVSKRHPNATEPVLRWQGLACLRESGQQVLHDRPIDPQNQTLSQEFNWALDSYVLTGKYPDELSPQVKDAISRIPTPQGKSLVDYIASGRYLKFDGQNYEQYLKPLLDELSEVDRQTGRSQQFEYRPSQTQDVARSKEAIQESDIMVRVNPFYGGYYREQVCRYDPNSKQIVKEAGVKETWDVEEPLDDEAVWQTQRNYRGKMSPGKETLIKLPYGALPIVGSIKPAGAFHLMRDELGIISLEPRVGSVSSEVVEFSFDFVMSENDSNKLNRPPIDRDVSPTGGALDPETQTLVDDLLAQNWMSDVQKAREIVRYIHKKLRYPNDESEIGQIDAAYLSAGSNLWTKIAETGIAHCYWANIFRDELCKRLGIASRIPTGPYINSKDPRFDFTVVEAPGVDKHAWGEVWNKDSQKWTHRGMDATPPKQKDDFQDDQSEPNQPLDGDFGDSLIEQPELSPEEVERMYQDLIDGLDQKPQPDPTPEQRAAEQFQKEKGVDYVQWKRLESWINNINNTPVPPEMSIRKRPSTLYQEWCDLFDLLYKRREVPYQAYKGPVRQSEGEFLDDPVTAYIDVRSKDDDPSGYQRSYEKQKEIIEVFEVDDDFVLDISGSMSGSAEEEMKKMVLSSSYNIMKLNERFQHSRNKTRMRTPLQIRSTQITFGSGATEVVEKEDIMSEKILVDLDRELQAKNQSSEGLVVALQKYQDSLDPETLAQIKQGKRSKILTIVSDGDVSSQDRCVALITQLRSQGVIVQGIGFGSAAEDIKVVCHDPADSEAAVVIDDVRQATLTRHKLLMKHLSKL
ncbi:MAG: transglutaminase domain-containing protein [Patescibacteria group bacterium]